MDHVDKSETALALGSSLMGDITGPPLIAKHHSSVSSARGTRETDDGALGKRTVHVIDHKERRRQGKGAQIETIARSSQRPHFRSSRATARCRSDLR